MLQKYGKTDDTEAATHVNLTCLVHIYKENNCITIKVSSQQVCKTIDGTTESIAYR